MVCLCANTRNVEGQRLACPSARCPSAECQCAGYPASGYLGAGSLYGKYSCVGCLSVG